MPNPAEIFLRHPGVTTLHLSSIKREEDFIQDEPLALVAKKPVKVEMQSPQKSISNDDDLSNEFTTSPTSNSSKRPPQRNYKNMTRERRIEANARERTRVHTISAAYETLRKSIPAYSNTQKLSKLSVLRVACSYILTLSRMAGEDYSHDGSEPSIGECSDSITKTIQTEGKIRKKKDEWRIFLKNLPCFLQIFSKKLCIYFFTIFFVSPLKGVVSVCDFPQIVIFFSNFIFL